MKYLLSILVSLLLFIGAWGAGRCAGMLAAAYGFGETFLWGLCLILSVFVLCLDIYWYLKKSGTDRGVLRGQATLFTTMAGISVLSFLILSGSQSFDFLFGGWNLEFRLENVTDFIVSSITFMLVSSVLAIIAWVKYRTRTPAPAAGAGGHTP